MSDDLRTCARCGKKRTRIGRWRCDDCQAEIDAQRAAGEANQLEAAYRRDHAGPDAEIVSMDRIRRKGLV